MLFLAAQGEEHHTVHAVGPPCLQGQTENQPVRQVLAECQIELLRLVVLAAQGTRRGLVCGAAEDVHRHVLESYARIWGLGHFW